MIYFAMIISVPVAAQEKDAHLSRGNDEFEDRNYSMAEAEYRISQSKSRTNAAAAYNLGTSIYRQGQASESKSMFLKSMKNATTHEQKHKAFHNLGNVLMKEKDYAGAVEAYKNALRNNPSDEETRYNYALAKKMLKENPPPKDKKDDKKDKKDDKKDKKDDKKKDDQKDKGDKDKDKDGKPKDDKKQGKPDQPKQQPQPKPQSGISKERLQNLLEAVNNEEKKIQDKVNAKKVKARPVETEKDW